MLSIIFVVKKVWKLLC